LTYRNQNYMKNSKTILTVALAALAILALACTSNTDDDIPEIERKTHSLNKAIMCPVCPGESIDQSQNPLAVSMRGIVAAIRSKIFLWNVMAPVSCWSLRARASVWPPGSCRQWQSWWQSSRCSLDSVGCAAQLRFPARSHPRTRC